MEMVQGIYCLITMHIRPAKLLGTPTRPADHVPPPWWLRVAFGRCGFKPYIMMYLLV